MKVLAILCMAVIATTLAQEDPATVPPFTCDGNAFVCKLKEIGHHIKFHAKNLGGKLSTVGTSILSTALDHAKNLLSTGGKAVLGTVMEHLNKSGIMGKRAIALGYYSVTGKVKEHMSKGAEWLKQIKEKLQAKFEAAVKKITGVMTDTATLKKVEGDAEYKIDGAVEGFKKDGKAGFLKMVVAIKDKLKAIFAEGMKKLKEMTAKKDEKRGIVDFWNSAKEKFSNILGGLSNTFKPHVDALKAGLKGLADKAKEHGSNLLTAAKGQFDALKGKLSTHLDALKGHASKLGGHAKTAVNALKEAVTSILTQTVNNSGDALKDALKTGTDALGVIAGHIKNAGN